MPNHYCDCGTPPSGAEVPGQTCGGCGGIIRRDPPLATKDHQETRIKELEQELADANCQCRIAEEKVGVLAQKFKESNEKICGLLEDIAGAENRCLELEEKGKVQPDIPGGLAPSVGSSTEMGGRK